MSKETELATSRSEEQVRRLSKLDKFYWRFLLPFMNLFEGRPAYHRAVGQKADIREGDKVLEMGAGYPLWRFYSKKTGEQGLFISLDIDPFIQKASQKICQMIDRFSKSETSECFLVADGNEPPFKEGEFDLVFVQSYGGGPEVLDQSFLVLKPEGRLIISEISHPAIKDDAVKRCEQIGFEVMEIRRIALNWCLIAQKPEEAHGIPLLSLVKSALRQKEQTPGERSSAIRIKDAIRKNEIQFFGSFPLKQEGPIALCISDFEGFEDRGKAVFLVFQGMWVGETVIKRKERPERLDYLYGYMKTALEEIDALRKEGVHILTKGEYEEILQQQRLSAEN
jgi:SAM-dependent methyltransferase